MEQYGITWNTGVVREPDYGYCTDPND